MCQWPLCPWTLPDEESRLTVHSAVAPPTKQPIPSQHASKHIARNAKHTRYFDLIVPAMLKGVYHDIALQPVPRLTGMLIENTLQLLLQRNIDRFLRHAFFSKGAQVLQDDLLFAANQQDVMNNVFQFANISGP